MPLDKRCSKPAFKFNVAAEIDTGKPQKQALAIAYSTLRRACGVGAPADMMTLGQIIARGRGESVENKPLSVVVEELRDILEVSKDPYQRAKDRIAAIIQRGQDPIKMTMNRVKATKNPAKLMGIWKVVREYFLDGDKKWKPVVVAARERYKIMTGRYPVPA